MESLEGCKPEQPCRTECGLQTGRGKRSAGFSCATFYHFLMRKILIWPVFLILVLACSLPADPASPALSIETLRAQASPDPSSTPQSELSSVPTLRAFSTAEVPIGRIVYTCQLAGDQLCLINADGTGFRQLTQDDNRHWYASFSQDGTSVIYSAHVDDNLYEIFELNLASGLAAQLTDGLGVSIAPEISPDGNSIVFALGDAKGSSQIWVMDRGGTNPHQIHGRGWDPTWSPDGTQILFASDEAGASQLFIMNSDGSSQRRVTHFDSLRGRSDWSPDGSWIVAYNGAAWRREVFIFRPDFTDVRQLTPQGGNSQGPSFSPDGRWVAFTAYFDLYGDDLGCEIYIIRVDGTNLRRLTDNAYCDYQPRWGP